MSTKIVSDPARVWEYLHSKGVVSTVTSGCKGLGLERDGELVAGALFEGYNGVNMWVHLAGDDSKRWMTKAYLHTCFDYVFNTAGCKRLSGQVEANNWQARRFDEHIGFSQEAVLKGAASDGGDVILYVMWRDQCRFLKE